MEVVVFIKTQQGSKDIRHVPKAKTDTVLWERWQLITIVKIKNSDIF